MSDKGDDLIDALNRDIQSYARKGHSEGGHEVSDKREPTLAEAVEELHRACHAVFVAPLLPFFTRLFDVLARWIDKVTP